MKRPRPEELIEIVRVNRPSDEALLAALRIALAAKPRKEDAADA